MEFPSLGCPYSLDWTTGLDYWTQNLTTKSHFPTITTTKIDCQSSSKAVPLTAKVIFQWGMERWPYYRGQHMAA